MPTTSTPSSTSKKPEESTGTTLAAIRKAAEDSGYNVYDVHQLVFLSGVKDGFSVEITADSQTTVYSFVECETEDAAAKNAKDIDDAGYNIAIRSGRLLTCYAVDKKDGTIKDILSSLLEGKTVDKTQYDSSLAEQDTTPSEGTDSESIIGTWVSGNASGRYNAESGKFDDVSGMGVIYAFYEDGTFAQQIVFMDYAVITGKYSVSDGLLVLTERVAIESDDNGETWNAQEALPDTSAYYEVGTGDTGTYLLLGQEDAVPPLEASVNAMKFSSEG